MGKAQTVTVREAALRAGWTLKYIYDLLYSGRLPGAQKVGRTWRIPVQAIEARLQAREEAA